MATVFLQAGQPVTRELVRSATIDSLRDRSAVRVHVLCDRCGEGTTTWLTPKDREVPAVLCDYCDWRLDQELAQ